MLSLGKRTIVGGLSAASAGAGYCRVHRVAVNEEQIFGAVTGSTSSSSGPRTTGTSPRSFRASGTVNCRRLAGSVSIVRVKVSD